MQWIDMKIKIDVRDNRVTDWLMNVVGVKNFKFDFHTEEIEFLHDEDFVAFKLKFMDPIIGGHDAGFFYCPFIPIFNYDTNKN